MSRIFTYGKYAGKSFEEVYKVYPTYVAGYTGNKGEFKAFAEYALGRSKEPPPERNYPQITYNYAKGHENYFLEKMEPYKIEEKPIGDPVETYFTKKLPLGEIFFLNAFVRYGILKFRGGTYVDPYVERILEFADLYPVYLPLLREALVDLTRETPIESVWVLSLAQPLVRGIIQDYEVNELKTKFLEEPLDVLAYWALERFKDPIPLLVTPLVRDPRHNLEGLPFLILPESGELLTLKMRQTPVIDLDFVHLALDSALYGLTNPQEIPIRKLTILDACQMVEVTLNLEKSLEGLLD